MTEAFKDPQGSTEFKETLSDEELKKVTRALETYQRHVEICQEVAAIEQKKLDKFETTWMPIIRATAARKKIENKQTTILTGTHIIESKITPKRYNYSAVAQEVMDYAKRVCPEAIKEKKSVGKTELTKHLKGLKKSDIPKFVTVVEPGISVGITRITYKE